MFSNYNHDSYRDRFTIEAINAPATSDGYIKFLDDLHPIEHLPHWVFAFIEFNPEKETSISGQAVSTGQIMLQ
jgi:hypothetical protein